MIDLKIQKEFDQKRLLEPGEFRWIPPGYDDGRRCLEIRIPDIGDVIITVWKHNKLPKESKSFYGWLIWDGNVMKPTISCPPHIQNIDSRVFNVTRMSMRRALHTWVGRMQKGKLEKISHVVRTRGYDDKKPIDYEDYMKGYNPYKQRYEGTYTQLKNYENNKV